MKKLDNKNYLYKVDGVDWFDAPERFNTNKYDAFINETTPGSLIRGSSIHIHTFGLPGGLLPDGNWPTLEVTH